jgi:hypothetical protein
MPGSWPPEAATSLELTTELGGVERVGWRLRPLPLMPPTSRSHWHSPSADDDGIGREASIFQAGRGVRPAGPFRRQPCGPRRPGPKGELPKTVRFVLTADPFRGHRNEVSSARPNQSIGRCYLRRRDKRRVTTTRVAAVAAASRNSARMPRQLVSPSVLGTVGATRSSPTGSIVLPALAGAHGWQWTMTV